jgi:hypothetical protein
MRSELDRERLITQEEATPGYGSRLIGWCHVLAIALSAMVITGCANQSGRNVAQPIRFYGPEIERVPYRTFDFSGIAGPGVPQLQVRLARPAEVSGTVWLDAWLSGPNAFLILTTGVPLFAPLIAMDEYG